MGIKTTTTYVCDRCSTVSTYDSSARPKEWSKTDILYWNRRRTVLCKECTKLLLKFLDEKPSI